mgnify:CR=1 FL=1
MEIEQAYDSGLVSKPKAEPPKADTYQVGGTHYQNMPMQPWVLMEAILTRDEWIGYLKGNLIKYAMRAGRKADSDDAGKAQHYRQKLQEALQQ